MKEKCPDFNVTDFWLAALLVACSSGEQMKWLRGKIKDCLGTVANDKSIENLGKGVK